MNKSPLLFSAVISFLVVGCSSRDDPQLTPIFHTDIRADDSKMFSLTLVGRNGSKAGAGDNAGDKEPKNQEKRKRGGGKGNGGKGGRGKGDRDNSAGMTPKQPSRTHDKTKQLEAILYETLEEQLATNQYCREGYFELEKSINRNLINIKGECNESATSSDRQNFIKK